MESLILHTFFGKINSIQVYHYDELLTIEKNKSIKTTKFYLSNKYNIKINSNIFFKNLESQEKELQKLKNINSGNCLHLDFANLDAVQNLTQDSFLSINSQNIRKVYFGYWELNYPGEYTEIIKQIKLIEINPDKTISTFIDKLRMLNIDIKNLGLFYSIPECEGLPKKVITIPGLRTMYQWGGLDTVELYKKLWAFSSQEMKTYIENYKNTLVENAFNTLERIKVIQTQTDFCVFCPVIQCLETKFKLNDSRPHPRLCRFCYTLTQETIRTIIMHNTPPVI